MTEISLVNASAEDFASFKEEEGGGFKLQVCPKCLEPMQSYRKENGWEEYLVCNKCGLADDISR